jgi:hypothetical protein
VHLSQPGGSDEALNGLLDQLGGVASLFPPIPVPLPDLPFELRITTVRTSADGLDLSATASDIVLKSDA